MFKSWCSKNKVKHAKARSHVLMDGGVLSIPFDKLDEFCEQYVEAVKNEEKLFLVEQKTPTYNFFIDIDYKDRDAMDLVYMKKMTRVICDKVKTLGGRDCLICVAKPKKTDKDMIKTGVHMNWPGFVVDQKGAMNVRDHVIATLSSVFRNKDWNQIIDLSVYKGSGFRIPWSYKKGKHVACNGQGCQECDAGKVTEPPYLPIFRYTYGPVMCLMNTMSQDPSVDVFKDSIIRTEVTDVATIPPLDGKRKLEGSFTQAQMKDEFRDSETIANLEAFIRAHMEGQANAHVTKIFTHKKHFLVSTTSKYCENLGRSHNSNHVWFHVVGSVIFQKCFCDCETVLGRRSGFCGDFRGREHRLPDVVVKKLYPDESPPKRNATPPPKEKLNVDEAIRTLEAYITQHVRPTRITALKKNRNAYIAQVAETKCDADHDAVCHFIIDEKGIGFVCSECKGTPRRHLLNKKSKEILFPGKK